MENLADNYKHINGWGHDIDPENEPTYPMKHYTGDDHAGLDYVRPTLQPENVEVLHSNERPNITAVFGTSVPPSGLSGMLRRYAFRYSESTLGHWLPLILADRINVVEALVDDVRRGHIPNLFSEWGTKADLKYNKVGLAKKIAINAIIAIVVINVVSSRKSKKHRK